MGSVTLNEERISMKSRDDVLRIHLLIKSYEEQYNLSLADINVLVELNNLGYNDKFFKSCIEKKYYRSKQTVMNAISKMTTMGILTYEKRGERKIDSKFLPSVNSEKVIFKYMIGNL